MSTCPAVPVSFVERTVSPYCLYLFTNMNTFLWLFLSPLICPTGPFVYALDTPTVSRTVALSWVLLLPSSWLFWLLLLPWKDLRLSALPPARINCWGFGWDSISSVDHVGKTSNQAQLSACPLVSSFFSLISST